MKTYKNRLFISNALILLAASIIVIVTSYYASRAIMITEIEDTKYRQMNVISSQLRYSIEVAEEDLRFIAMEADLVDAVAQINRSQSSDYVSARNTLHDLLSVHKTANPQFKNMYIFTPKNIISADGIVTDIASEFAADIKNPYIARLVTNEQISEYVTSRNEAVFKDNVLISSIDQKNFIIGTLDIGKLIDRKVDGLLYVFDDSENLIYADDAAADKVDYAQEIAARSGEALATPKAWGQQYLPLSFTQYIDGYKYILLVDIGQSTAPLSGPLYQLILLSIPLFLMFVFILYMLARYIVSPVRQLGDAVQSILHSSDDNVIHQFLSRMSMRGKLRTVIYIYYMVVLIPLITIVIASYYLFKDVIIREVEYTYAQTVNQVADNAGMRVNGYISLSKRITFDNKIVRMLTSQEDAASLYIPEILNRHGVMGQNITSVKLYDQQGNMRYSTNESYDALRLDYAVMQQFTKPYTYSYFDMNDMEVGKGTFYFAIRNLDTSKGNLFQLIGYLELDISDLFDDWLTNVSELTPYSVRYIYDKKAWQLINTAATVPYRNIAEGLAQGGLIDAGVQKLIHVNDSEMLITSSDVKGTSWMIFYMIPLKKLMDENLKIIYYNILTICAVLFITMLIAGLLTISMMKPINRIQRYFRTATPEGKILPATKDTSNEIGVLALSFKELLDRISSLNTLMQNKEKERFEQEKRKKEAQIVALQAQMDPHLIFNIFTTMKFLLKAGQSELLGNTIEATGNFLRNSLLVGDYDVLLSKEIAYVEAYLEIQMIRFMGRLQVEWSYEREDVSTCKVPKYLIQPLIENAIVHGMPQDRILHINIVIHGDSHAKELLISVMDDGLGITDEKLQEINQMLTEGQSSVHVGLLNIHERIRLHYGDQYGLWIERVSGVSVSVRLPITGEASECLN